MSFPLPLRPLCRLVAAGAVALILAFAAGAVLAAGEGATDRSWQDPRFGKSWSLTPTGEEVLLWYQEGTTAEARQAIVSASGLAESHPFDPTYETAVYRVAPGVDIEALAESLGRVPGVRGAAPAVRDQEGYVKYYVPGQLLVQLDGSLSDADCRRLIARQGSEVLEDYWTPGFYKISTPAGADVFSTLRRWLAVGEIVFAEPAYMCYNDAAFVPNDPLFPQQWSEQNTGQQNPWVPGADVQAVDAWDIERGSPNVIVAVIDTGMDLNHEDLRDNLLPRNGADWDFASSDTSPDDEGDHGTACSGIAVGVQDNGIGISGIAPGCRIMPLRVNLSSGQNANRADAINYAASRRAEFDGLVMSCSWLMSSGDFTAVENAVVNADELDCVVCFATGNDNGPVRYPAKYEQTIAVGATSPCDERKRPGSCDGEGWGSNYGPENDVVAPGVKIYTTDRSGGAGYSSGNYFATFNGTSSATPLVAGICALILSANPGLTNDEVRAILQGSAEDQVGPPNEDVPGWDQYMGWGRVNAYQAVLLASVPETFEDDMEAGGEPWTHSPATPGWTDPWHLSQQRNHTEGGSHSWKCGPTGDEPYGSRVHAALVTPRVHLPESAVLSFWHYIDADTLGPDLAADGGLVEISTDSGTTWQRLDPMGGYDYAWGPNTLAPFSQGTPVFSGSHDWRLVFIDLAAYAGRNVQVRFRFGTRPLVPPGQGGEGWYIDDVLLGTLDISGVDASFESAPIRLLTPSPNPSRDNVVLRFRLDAPAPVAVHVSDASGRLVWSRSLGVAAAGEHPVVWNGLDASGRMVPAGVYFYRLESPRAGAQGRLVRLGGVR